MMKGEGKESGRLFISVNGGREVVGMISIGYFTFFVFLFFFLHFISASQCGVFTEGYECSKLNPYIWATRIAPASSPGAIFKNVGDFRRPFGHALRRTAVVHVLRRLAGP